MAKRFASVRMKVINLRTREARRSDRYLRRRSIDALRARRRLENPGRINVADFLSCAAHVFAYGKST
jgi:hypothetical protein